MIRSKYSLKMLALSAGILAAAPSAWAQHGTSVAEGDWPDYNGNMAAQRYSPLDQINADNVDDLQLAFEFDTRHFGSQQEFTATFTPLEVDGVLYTTIGAQRDVIALDATTGQQLWQWRAQ